MASLLASLRGSFTRTSFALPRRTITDWVSKPHVPPLVNFALEQPPAVIKRSPRPAPPASPFVKSPEDFLKAIGRASETKYSSESWQDFWNLSGQVLRKAGVAVRDRRYILWCMEKYRQGYPIKTFAHEATPKKTVRGWGPKVQNGKRIRSRRIKNKQK